MDVQMSHLPKLWDLLLCSGDFPSQFKTNDVYKLSKYFAVSRECSHYKYRSLMTCSVLYSIGLQKQFKSFNHVV